MNIIKKINDYMPIQVESLEYVSTRALAPLFELGSDVGASFSSRIIITGSVISYNTLMDKDKIILKPANERYYIVFSDFKIIIKDVFIYTFTANSIQYINEKGETIR